MLHIKEGNVGLKYFHQIGSDKEEYQRVGHTLNAVYSIKILTKLYTCIQNHNNSYTVNDLQEDHYVDHLVEFL